MSAVEAAVPFIADVLADLAKRVSALDGSVERCGADAARVRELIEGAVTDDDGTGQKGDAPGAAP
jgi:hypothetical protein